MRVSLLPLCLLALLLLLAPLARAAAPASDDYDTDDVPQRASPPASGEIPETLRRVENNGAGSYSLSMGTFA